MSCHFFASKTYEIHVNAIITVEVFGRISFHVMAENWKHLKDTLAFSSCILGVRIEIESGSQVICCPIYHWLLVSHK